MFPVSDVIPSRTTPVVTITLIATNALVFLYELTLDDRQLQALVQSYGVVPAHFSLLTLVTSLFLHGGWLHFLGNMLYLWIFGDNVEDRLGHGRFAIFYIGCGAAAASARWRRARCLLSRWLAPAARSRASWALTSCSFHTRAC